MEETGLLFLKKPAEFLRFISFAVRPHTSERNAPILLDINKQLQYYIFDSNTINKVELYSREEFCSIRQIRQIRSRWKIGKSKKLPQFLLI